MFNISTRYTWGLLDGRDVFRLTWSVMIRATEELPVVLASAEEFPSRLLPAVDQAAAQHGQVVPFVGTLHRPSAAENQGKRFSHMPT